MAKLWIASRKGQKHPFISFGGYKRKFVDFSMPRAVLGTGLLIVGIAISPASRSFAITFFLLTHYFYNYWILTCIFRSRYFQQLQRFSLVFQHLSRIPDFCSYPQRQISIIQLWLTSIIPLWPHRSQAFARIFLPIANLRQVCQKIEGSCPFLSFLSVQERSWSRWRYLS